MDNTNKSARNDMHPVSLPERVGVETLIEGVGDEAVVFFHSSASGISQWAAYQEALSNRYTTAAVHLFGYGATTPWRGPRRQRLADQGRLAGTVIEALRRPTHLVGHSFGGAVALEAARQFRDRVLSVVVFEPTLFWTLRSEAPGSWDEVSAMIRAVQTGVARGDLAGAAAGFVNYWAQDERWGRMSDRQRSTVAAAMAAVAHEGDALMSPPAHPEAWLADVPAPTLVITAPDSPAPAREIARLLTITGQRQLGMLNRGGHMAPISHPADVLAVVEPFLNTFVGRSTTRGAQALAAV